MVPHGKREREEVFHQFGAKTPGVGDGFQISLNAVRVMIAEPKRMNAPPEELIPSQLGLGVEALLKKWEGWIG